MARNITRIVGEPILLKGHEIKLEATIGIAEYPTDGTLTGDIIERAYGAISAPKRGHSLRSD